MSHTYTHTLIWLVTVQNIFAYSTKPQSQQTNILCYLLRNSAINKVNFSYNSLTFLRIRFDMRQDRRDKTDLKWRFFFSSLAQLCTITDVFCTVRCLKSWKKIFYLTNVSFKIQSWNIKPHIWPICKKHFNQKQRKNLFIHFFRLRVLFPLRRRTQASRSPKSSVELATRNSIRKIVWNSQKKPNERKKEKKSSFFRTKANNS